MRIVWESDAEVATSSVAYTELRSAIGAASRDQRVPRRHVARLVQQLEDAWTRIVTFDVDEELARSGGEVAARHALEALDAIHLATALRLADPELTFVSWDARLRDAASDVGLAVVPA